MGEITTPKTEPTRQAPRASPGRTLPAPGAKRVSVNAPPPRHSRDIATISTGAVHSGSPDTSEEVEVPKAPDRYDLAMRRVGNVLDGKWKLDSLLGVGGMAAVYSATHRNGARAAIKFLPFSMVSGPELCQRLLREGYLANKIHHNAVVRVLDDHIDYDKEHAYIVMELLEGETTRQRIERAGTFEPLQAIELMVELCDCLRAAHHANVVHRDIKPENLFLTKEGLKVLDFGIARAMDGNSSLTQTGTSLGTPAYMSPEQARGKQNEITPRSDLYSVGATLLFLLTGETLHEGDNPMELMVRAAWTPPPRAKKRCPHLPSPVADVIDRCCSFAPEDRYPDADALIAALESTYRQLSSAPPPPSNRLVLAPPEPGRISSLPRRSLMAETISVEGYAPPTRPLASSWFLLLAGAAAVLAVAFFLATRNDSDLSTHPDHVQSEVVSKLPSTESKSPLPESSGHATTTPPERAPAAPAALEDVPASTPPEPAAVPNPRTPKPNRVQPAPKPAPGISDSVARETPPRSAAPPPPAAAPKTTQAPGKASNELIDIDYGDVNRR